MRFLVKTIAAWSLLIALTIISLFVGVMEVTPATLFNDAQALQTMIISRVPRTAAIILSGLALSASGLVMQIIMHNRFVEPSTTGTPQGVAIGLLLSTLFIPDWPLIIKMAVGALSGFISLMLFLQLAKRLAHTDTLLIPLAGLIYGGILHAGVTFIAYETDLLQLIGVWLNGDFSAVLEGRYELLWGCAIVGILMYLAADKLTIVGMGERISQTLGVHYHHLVLIALILISISTALVVSTIGMIAFLGLVVPNIVKRFVGDNLNRSLPWSVWLGCVLLLMCDILSRVLIFPFEIPVSLIFGILGAVIFLYLIWRPVRYA